MSSDLWCFTNEGGSELLPFINLGWSQVERILSPTSRWQRFVTVTACLEFWKDWPPTPGRPSAALISCPYFITVYYGEMRSRMLCWIALILAFAAVELRAADSKECEGKRHCLVELSPFMDKLTMFSMCTSLTLRKSTILQGRSGDDDRPWGYVRLVCSLHLRTGQDR